MGVKMFPLVPKMRLKCSVTFPALRFFDFFALTQTKKKKRSAGWRIYLPARTKKYSAKQPDLEREISLV